MELKIDPKRLRKEIKNDIEKIRTKRKEKKSIKSDMIRKKDSPYIATPGQVAEAAGPVGG